MAQPSRLIVGLGNPGPEYDGTRHNIGFTIVDALAGQAGCSFSRESGNVLLASGAHRGHRYALAKPLTYMNRSGSAVRTLVQRFGLTPREVLVVVDDLNLEPGRLRLRPRGSAGGHNGMQDIIDELETDDVPRLRVGIGNAFERGRQADYVLSPFSPDEQPVIDEAVEKACGAILTFVCEGVETAMNRFN